jgi:ABC-type transporter Mla subunit MlaD
MCFASELKWSPMQRATWTDERLDDLVRDVDRRFDQVDRRFDEVDRRFEQVDRRFDQIDQRFDRVEDSIRDLAVNVRHLTTLIMWFAAGLVTTLIGAIAVNGAA